MSWRFAKIVTKSSQFAKGVRNVALILPLFAVFASCNDSSHNFPSQRERLAESVRFQSILAMERPPVIVVKSNDDLRVADNLVSRLNIQKLAARKDTEYVDADALPWLSGSAPGREFLAARGSRVLVRGHPQEFCPIALTETAAGSVPIRNVARTAFNRCLAQVPPGCGCRLIAMQDALLATQEEVTYATGIAARIKARSLGLDDLLVAEEQQDGSVILRDLSGVIGSVVSGPDDAVTIKLKGSETVYSGTARDVGFRRGRVAQRIYAKNEAGERVSLLIGFNPDELAEFAGAWLAWPPDA